MAWFCWYANMIPIFIIFRPAKQPLVTGCSKLFLLLLLLQCCKGGKQTAAEIASDSGKIQRAPPQDREALRNTAAAQRCIEKGPLTLV